MTFVRRLSCVAVIAAAVLAAGVPAQAASGTQLVGVTITADKTSLTGIETATMTVGLHLTDPDGVQPSDNVVIFDGVDTVCPCALVSGRFVRLDLTSGSPQDGVWTGTTVIGASARGHYQLQAVIAGTLRHPPEFGGVQEWYDVNGADYGPGLDISGTNWPVLTISAPSPVAYGTPYVLSGRATYSDTGAPVVGVPVGVWKFYDPGDLAAIPPTMVTTDSTGKWSARFSQPALDGVTVAWARDDQVGTWNGIRLDRTQWSSYADKAGPRQHWTVSLTVSHSGLTRYLVVHLTPRYPYETVQLQHRTSTGWKAIATAVSKQPYGACKFSTRVPGVYRVRALLMSGFLAPWTSLAVRAT